MGNETCKTLGLVCFSVLVPIWGNMLDFYCGLMELAWTFVFFTDVFEKALNAGFIQATDYVEIWQAYLDYLRRRVDFSKGGSSCV